MPCRIRPSHATSHSRPRQPRRAAAAAASPIAAAAAAAGPPAQQPPLCEYGAAFLPHSLPLSLTEPPVPVPPRTHRPRPGPTRRHACHVPAGAGAPALSCYLTCLSGAAAAAALDDSLPSRPSAGSTFCACVRLS